VRGDFRDDLGDSGRTARQVGRQPRHVRDGVFELAAEVDPLPRLGENELQMRQAADTPGDGNDHAAELSHQLVEVSLGARLSRPGELAQDFKEARGSTGRQFDRPRDGIDEPTEDDFDRLQGAIPFEQLLEADRVLLPLVVGLVGRSEYPVDAVEQDAAYTPATARSSLDELDEVVYVHVGVAEGSLSAVSDARRWTRP